MPSWAYDVPPTWNSGIATMFLSPSSNSNPSCPLTVCAMRLAWVSATPLGRPVVPDEYMMMHDVVGVDIGRRGRPAWPTASSASYSSPSSPSGVTSMTCSTFGELVADLVDVRLEFLADDQHLGAGVVEHVVQLVGGEPEVDDRVGRAQRCGGQRHLQAGGVVLVEERDHIAAFDAAFLERAGQPAHAVVPLRPRPGSVEIGDGLVVGLGFCPVGQTFVEKAGISQRQTCSSVPRRLCVSCLSA